MIRLLLATKKVAMEAHRAEDTVEVTQADMVEATRTEGSVATLAEAMATVQVPEDSEVVA